MAAWIVILFLVTILVGYCIFHDIREIQQALPPKAKDKKYDTVRERVQ